MIGVCKNCGHMVEEILVLRFGIVLFGKYIGIRTKEVWHTHKKDNGVWGCRKTCYHCGCGRPVLLK